MRTLPLAMVFRKLPYLEDIRSEDRGWALRQARETDDMFQRYCVRLGNMIIVPDLYTSILSGLLDEKKAAFRSKGYDVCLKICRPDFDEAEMLRFRTQILAEVKDQVSEAFQEVRKQKYKKRLASSSERILQYMNRAKELLLLFNLEKAFPMEALKISDLIDQLQAKLDGNQILEQEFGKQG